MSRHERIQAWIMQADDSIGPSREPSKPADLPDEWFVGMSPEDRRTEREEVFRLWNELRTGSRGLALPENFGQDRVADWCRPRPEGVLFGAPLALAASLLCLISLVPALGGMKALGAVRVATVDLETVASMELVHPGTVWTATPDQPARSLQLAGGRRIDWSAGTIQVVSARHLQIELEEQSDLQLELGFGETVIDVGDCVLRARDCNINIWGSLEHGAWIEVERGVVGLRDGRSGVLTLLRAGDRYALQPERRADVPSIGPIGPIGPELPIESVREPDTELGGDHPNSVDDSGPQPEEKSEEETRPSVGETEAEALLVGVVSSRFGTLGPEGARVRLVREGIPYDDLLQSLNDRHVERSLEQAELLRRSRSEVLERHEVELEQDGTFSVSLEPGLYSVRVTAPGMIASESISMRLSRGQERSLMVTLEPGEAVLGQVFDAEGVPVEGASVFAVEKTFETNRYGEVRIPGTVGTVPVVVDSPDSEPYFGRLGNGQTEGRIRLSAGVKRTVDVRAQLGGELRAQVRAEWMRAGQRFIRRGERGPGGTYVLQGLPTAGSYVLVTQGEGWRADRRVIQAADDHDSSIEVALAPARIVSGLVLDASDDAVDSTLSLLDGERVLRDSIVRGKGEVAGLALYASATGLVSSRGWEAQAFEVGVAEPSWGSLVLHPDAGSRVLFVLDSMAEPLQDAWVLWIVRDLATGRWIQARVLRETESGCFELPANAKDFAESGFEAAVLAGAVDHESVLAIDPGGARWDLSVDESLHSR